ncbi:M15 family metallopeptidase [Alteromonas sp. CYL-A6]|uniref:M15 family metallopeptidase n=1 Tax=Alteromonas nitratireducens TaxID=3390813 RepID=UPI0034BE2178
MTGADALTREWLSADPSWLADAGDGHRLHHDVVGPFVAMQQAAREDGIDCQIVSGYRSVERQLSIWNRKWHGALPLYDQHGEKLDTAALSDSEKLHAILMYSALPGASRHHWGTDLDVYDKQRVQDWSGNFSLVNDEYLGDGPCAVLSQWLDDHAADYGFSRPYAQYQGGVAPELWHLSHRQTAQPFEAALRADALKTFLSGADVAGKTTILAAFDTLFTRYVLNQGTL